MAVAEEPWVPKTWAFPEEEALPAGGTPSGGLYPHSMPQGRVARGLRLVGMSFEVVRARPQMLLVMFGGMVGGLVICGELFWAVFGRVPRTADFRFPHYLVLLPILVVGTLASTFSNFVVAAMAAAYMRGETMTTAEGVALACRPFGRLVVWTLVAGVVGLVMQVIHDRLKIGGVIAQWLVGLAWSVLSVFVVPILVLEDVTVTAAVRRSAQLVKRTWGESVTATGTVGAGLGVVFVPAMVVAMIVGSAFGVVGVIAAMVVSLVVLVTVSGALGTVVSVALYSFATEGTAPGPSPATTCPATTGHGSTATGSTERVPGPSCRRRRYRSTRSTLRLPGGRGCGGASRRWTDPGRPGRPPSHSRLANRSGR